MQAIDCQLHWYPEKFLEWCLDRTSFPRCRRSGDGYAYELAPDVFLEFEGAMIDLEQLFERMSAGGVDVLIGSSEPALDVTGWPVEEAPEAARRLNELKAEAQRENAGRFYGLATVPMQDPDAAIAELEHAIDGLGLVGVCIPSNFNGSPITSPELLPVYKKMEELQAPLFLHPTRSIANERLPDYGLEFAIGYMFDTSAAALNLVFSGTMDACPDLKIVHPHLGAVLPYLADRIDVEYSTPWAGNEGFDGPPSKHLKRFYTDIVNNNPAALRMAIDFYGIDKILYASDYPWWTPEMGFELVNGELDESQMEKVLRGNAKQLLRIDP
ncbi:MAG: amidohydrolase family protein [Solirubrobacterales bacterium]